MAYYSARLGLRNDFVEPGESDPAPTAAVVTQSRFTQVGFDLWEEVNSYSFFTSSAHHRALRQGAGLATTMKDTARHSNYLTVADRVLCFLQVSFVHFAGSLHESYNLCRAFGIAQTITSSQTCISMVARDWTRIRS